MRAPAAARHGWRRFRAGALALALLAAACDVPRPNNREADAPAGAADAVSIAITEWSERLAADLPEEGPPVLWFGGRCLDYFLIGEDGECRTGRTWDWWGEVEIHVIARPLPSDSALAHELLHWALLERDDDQDAGHGDAAWGEVAWVRLAMERAGL